MAKKVTIPFGENASIVGVSVDKYVNRFTGIPFALPPVGQNRWKHPQPLPSDYFSKLDGPYDATDFKDLCLQPPSPIPHASAQKPNVPTCPKPTLLIEGSTLKTVFMPMFGHHRESRLQKDGQ